MLIDRLPNTNPVTPGTLTTALHRTRVLMHLYRAGHAVPRWVELALRNQLRSSVVGGVVR